MMSEVLLQAYVVGKNCIFRRGSACRVGIGAMRTRTFIHSAFRATA